MKTEDAFNKLKISYVGNKEHKDKISAYHKLKYISAKPHKIRCSVCGKFFYSKFNCKYNHNAKCLKQY